MQTVEQIVTSYRQTLAEFSDEVSRQADDDDPDLLIRLDDAATKLTGVLGLIKKIEQGTKKYPEMILISEAVGNTASVIESIAMLLLNYVTQSDAERFRNKATKALAEFELPEVDALTARSIDRMNDELQRSISNSEKLMSAWEIKKVIRAAQSISTKGRRIAKTSLQAGLYQPTYPLIRTLADTCVVTPLVELLQQDSDWRNRNAAIADELYVLAEQAA